MKTSNLQKLNLKLNNKTNYIHHIGIVTERVVNHFLFLNKADYFKQALDCCVIMVIRGNDTFYFLTVSLVNNEEVISGEQAILEKADTKVYIGARSFTSSHFIDRLIRSRRYEELYILSDDRVFDYYKNGTLIETALDIMLTTSTTALDPLHFQKSSHPCLKVIVNSCQVIPKKINNLPNASFCLQILPAEGVVDVISEFLSFVIEIPNIRALSICCKKEFSKLCNIPGCIVDILQENTDLECLNISDNNLDDGDFSKISEKLVCMSCLKSIDISNNEITDKNYTVVELVLQNNNGLKEINLSNICVNEIAFSASLKTFTQLTTLKLSCALIGLSQKAAANLSEVIASNIDLECLDISGNQIGDSISEIFKSMRHHKSLKTLNVSNNQISGASMQSLFAVYKYINARTVKWSLLQFYFHKNL